MRCARNTQDLGTICKSFHCIIPDGPYAVNEQKLSVNVDVTYHQAREALHSRTTCVLHSD